MILEEDNGGELSNQTPLSGCFGDVLRSYKLLHDIQKSVLFTECFNIFWKPTFSVIDDFFSEVPVAFSALLLVHQFLEELDLGAYAICYINIYSIYQSRKLCQNSNNETF